MINRTSDSSTFTATEKKPEKPIIASEYLERSELAAKLGSNGTASPRRSGVDNMGQGGLSPPNVSGFPDAVNVN